ncbi:hypothetical protein EDS67_09625 [candidate division KSB1 bacterium]|nr:MAG: hypothetical protein EDS67_09625 [candidate division KSB1 bacterium]MCE7941540.1 hypothetical protein [Chlorobi bacterium CHB1]MDL1876722.1 hypothetical protein [Cytophagia bacterium CHB2]
MNYKRNHRRGMLLLLLPVLLLWSCKEDNPTNPDNGNEQELITTVTLSLTENGTSNVVTATFKDPDGDGGAAPTFGTLTLKAGSTYTGKVELLDESKNPAEDITEEVKEEAEAHQFFYTPQGALAGRLTVTITDKDSNNLPVGLEFTVAVLAGGAVTGSATNSLNVVLSHFDNTPKNGADRSDESDIDINIPVTITD